MSGSASLRQPLIVTERGVLVRVLLHAKKDSSGLRHVASNPLQFPTDQGHCTGPSQGLNPVFHHLDGGVTLRWRSLMERDFGTIGPRRRETAGWVAVSRLQEHFRSLKEARIGDH
jgi:hypothetical protein